MQPESSDVTSAGSCTDAAEAGDNTSDAPVDAMAMMYLYHHPLNNERISYPIPRVPPSGSGHQH